MTNVHTKVIKGGRGQWLVRRLKLMLKYQDHHPAYH
jgi:hypothetical protein